MTVAYLLLVAGYLAAAAALIALILIVDLGDRQVEAEAAEFRRRLAAIPDLERPEAGHDIPTLPVPSRGGGVVPGGRAVHSDRGVLGASPSTRHRGRAPDPRI